MALALPNLAASDCASPRVFLAAERGMWNCQELHPRGRGCHDLGWNDLQQRGAGERRQRPKFLGAVRIRGSESSYSRTGAILSPCLAFIYPAAIHLRWPLKSGAASQRGLGCRSTAKDKDAPASLVAMRRGSYGPRPSSWQKLAGLCSRELVSAAHCTFKRRLSRPFPALSKPGP